jgi:hypothetical protein
MVAVEVATKRSCMVVRSGNPRVHAGLCFAMRTYAAAVRLVKSEQHHGSFGGENLSQLDQLYS